MEDILGIVDMDGFMVEKRFYCKELGVWKVGETYAKSYMFDTCLKWEELSEKDKKQCTYVMKYVHCLPFGPTKNAQSLVELRKIIREFYDEYKRENAVIAYKGGNFERDLLTEMGIPNLEEYGCPKATQLFKELGWLESCGNHGYEHCPKVETEAYGHWLENVSMFALVYTSLVHALVCNCTCLVMDVKEAAEILLSLRRTILEREALQNRQDEGIMLLWEW
jgi:hypothetical protein